MEIKNIVRTDTHFSPYREVQYLSLEGNMGDTPVYNHSSLLKSFV